jgi:leucyl aminopeptidase
MLHISTGIHVTEHTGLVLIPSLGLPLQLPEKMEEIQVSPHLFSGKKDTVFTLEYPKLKQTIQLIGLGDSPTYAEIKTAFRRISSKQKHLISSDVLIIFPDTFDKWKLEAAVSGFILGTYNLGHYKAPTPDAIDWNNVGLKIQSNLEESKILCERAKKIALAQIETCRMVDLPPNEVTPDFLAKWAVDTGKRLELKVEVLGKEKAAAENLHAFLAVAQGSNKPPQFIIMEHRHPDAKKHIGLVGKGVTFDTGGLNIKTAGMVHMKSDMAGAAAVLGFMQLVADLKLPVNITAIVPCVENAVDQDAYLPSSIIKSHSGKTIEIIDTDAEGRLILADGLSYLITKYQTDFVIDLATLTGSAVGTFGFECAAMFSNNSTLSDKLFEAGLSIGEKVWALPLWESYGSEMDSELADIKNYHGKPYAGAITAAKFLQAFTHSHPGWAHLDIAGTAYGDSEFAKTKHATAFGLHLLLNLVENV